MSPKKKSSTGYLTIKGYDEEFFRYILGFPNREVEMVFIRQLAAYYLPVPYRDIINFLSQLVEAVEQGAPESFLSLMQTMFEDNNYQVQGKMEIYFQNCMYLIFKIMGFYTEVEHCTARGRIDVVVKTADYIYVIEVKLDGSADEALQQIEEKGYATPFAHDGRKLYKVGVNFSSELKGIQEWQIVS